MTTLLAVSAKNKDGSWLALSRRVGRNKTLPKCKTQAPRRPVLHDFCCSQGGGHDSKRTIVFQSLNIFQFKKNSVLGLNVPKKRRFMLCKKQKKKENLRWSCKWGKSKRCGFQSNGESQLATTLKEKHQINFRCRNVRMKNKQKTEKQYDALILCKPEIP